HIEAFHADGLLKTPVDVFRLRRRAREIEEREGWGEKSVERLIAAIEARRTIGLDRFINALGIPQVGQSTARLLARHYGSLAALRRAMTEVATDPASEAAAELDNIDQIGPSVARDLAAFFAERHNLDQLDELARELTVPDFVERIDASSPIAG